MDKSGITIRSQINVYCATTANNATVATFSDKNKFGIGPLDRNLTIPIGEECSNLNRALIVVHFYLPESVDVWIKQLKDIKENLLKEHNSEQL